jgi:hypothetical protein
MIPGNKIPMELKAQLFSPEYKPPAFGLNNFVREAYVPVAAEVIENKVANAVNVGQTLVPGSAGVEIPLPLTEAEAEAADQQIAATLAKIAITKKRVQNFRLKLGDAVLKANGNKELHLALKVKNRGRVRRAMRAIFGEDSDTITYSMYMEMLEAKAKLEAAEVSDYSVGKVGG